MSKQREKAIAVIESCITEEQLPVAFKYICLFHKQTQDSDSYFALLTMLKAKGDNLFTKKKVIEDIKSIDKQVANAINARKPTPSEINLHRTLNNFNTGLEPLYEPFYQRRIKLSTNEHGS